MSAVIIVILPVQPSFLQYIGHKNDNNRVIIFPDLSVSAALWPAAPPPTITILSSLSSVISVILMCRLPVTSSLLSAVTMI